MRAHDACIRFSRRSLTQAVIFQTCRINGHASGAMTQRSGEVPRKQVKPRQRIDNERG